MRNRLLSNSIDQKDAAGTYDMFDAKLGNCVFYLGTIEFPQILLIIILLMRKRLLGTSIDQKDAAGTYDMFDAKLGTTSSILVLLTTVSTGSNTKNINAEQTAQHQDN